MKKICFAIFSVHLIALLSCNQASTKKSPAENNAITSADTIITFFTGTWTEALSEAAKRHKPIFVDAFAAWCAPCKMMEKTVFKLPEVGKYYNKHFISYRMDVEKGEGIDFKKKYTITGYPSFLFFNEDGSLAHQVQGSDGVNNAAGFIALAKEASNPELALFSLKRKYDSGNREDTFLLKYLLAKLRAFHFTENCSAEMEEYIKLHPLPLDVTVGNWTFIQSFITDINHPYFKELQNKKTKFTGIIYANEINKKIYSTEMDYYLEKKDWKNYTTSAVNMMESVSPVDIWAVNDIAWNFYEHVIDTVYLGKALAWMQKATEHEIHYEFYDTYSHLLYKTGDKIKATENAKLALDAAKKEGSDVADMEKWFKEISK